MKVWFTDYIKRGNVNGFVIETDTGALINAPYNNMNIQRSTDGGRTWSQVHTRTGRGQLKFVTSRGHIYLGSNELGVIGAQAHLLRSTDDGLTFTDVLTVDSGATWRMVEDAAGNLYVSEYSAGNNDANELFAYNVWKSAANGASTGANGSWSKWHQHAQQSVPGAKDEMRHIHLLAVDSAGQMYISYGDTPGYGGDAGKLYKLNTDGTKGALVGTFGNGCISFVEADDGKIVLGGDLQPCSMYLYDKSNGNITTTMTFSTDYVSAFSSPIYDLVKGKFGVIYGRVNVEGTGTNGALIASADNGATWHILDLQNTWGAGIHLWLNRNRTSSRLYVSNASQNYISVPDMTKQQLLSFVSVKGRRIVDWNL